MSTPIRSVMEEPEGDEAGEKLLDGDQVLVVPSAQRDGGLLAVKSSKKVKLPEDAGGAVGAGRFTIGPAPEEQDWEMVPPDGKWGWFVLVGATLVNILIPGTIKSFGVLLVEFNDVFHTSAAASSGIVALCYFLYSSLGPISSILSVKWSYRTVTLIGGSLSAFGMILSSLAFSISYLYFSFGALVGAGAGLAFPPTVYIVTSYFVRLRGLANGICMSGSAFGSIVLPPVLRYLLNTYGYKGAVLILGGIMLNTWAAALLFQPVEEHMVRKYKEPEEEEEDPGPQLGAFAEESGDTEDQPKPVFTPEEIPASNGSPPIFKNHSNAHLEDRESPNKEFARSASAVQMSIERTRKISTPVGSRNALHNITSRSHLPSNPSLLESVPEGRSNRVNSQEAFLKKLQVPKTPKRSPSNSSFQYMSTPFHGSTLSAFEKPSEFASQFSLKSATGSLAHIRYCCGYKKRPIKKNQININDDNGKKEPNKYFDIQLLKDPIYLVILISNCTSAISYTNFIILVPSYAKECGFDKSLGAYLLSIISALDLVGRIGGSAVSDVVSTPKRYFFIFGLLLSGISLSMIPLVSTYSAISVFCSVFGLASGIMTGVTALVMTEMLGTERLMSSYGISLFVNGILQLIGPPICGFWFEYTQSYKSLFVTLGFVLIGGAALWGFVPFIFRRRKLAEQSKEGTEKA